jgi:hypothetical protein
VGARALDKRVEILEQKVGRLETLPDRVAGLEVQISDFRAEVRTEFSATRAEMRALHEDVIDRIRILGERPKDTNGRRRP